MLCSLLLRPWSKLIIVGFGTLSIVTVIAAPLRAEPTSAREPAVVEEALTVTEVQVPVTIFDMDGQPVRGLTLEDFELIDNGRRQEILRLETIDLDAIEPGGSRSEVERAVPAAARRYFLLLFDHTFATPSAIQRAQEASRGFVVETLHPTDLAAVAVMTADAGPRLIVTFTPDRAQVARGIDLVGSLELLGRIEGRDPLGFLIETPTSSAGTTALSRESPLESDYTGTIPDSMKGYMDVISQRMGSVEKSFSRGQIEAWSASMAQLAQALNSLRGRKYVVYFSEGFDSRFLYGEVGNMASVAGRELTPLEQNQAGVLDSEELYGSGGLRKSIDDMLRQFRRSDGVIEAIEITASGAMSDQKASKESTGSLFYLANETGGGVYRGGGPLAKQLEVMLRRSAVTYLLTFQPSRLQEDGSYHRLKVKASLPAGAELTHRAGYYAPKPFDELHPVEKDLLLADAIAGATPSRDVAVRVLAAPFPASEAAAYVPVVLEIAGDSLIVDHDDDRLPVEIYAYVSDKQGEMRDFFTHVLTFDLTGRREAFRQSGIKYYGHLDLTAGEDYLLRVVVRNAATGRTGVETTVLNVPDYSTHEPVLLPPFFVESARRWFMVREQPIEQVEQEWMIYPFTIKGEPFVPAVVPTMRASEDIELCLIAYNLGVEQPELTGTVLSDGKPRAGGRIVVEDHIVATKSGVDKLVVRFSPTGLEAGDYDLRLDLLDPSWGQAALQQVSFRIVE